MRTFKNLFLIDKYTPNLEEYVIGKSKVFVYQNLDSLEEIYYSKRISTLFKLFCYSDYEFFWFSSFEEMYEDLEEYLGLIDFDLKIIVIID